MNRQNKKSITKVILQVIIYGIVIFFVYISLKGNLNKIEEFRIENYWYLGVAILIQAVTVFLFSHIWHLMMVLGNEKVRILDSYNVYVSSYVTRYIPGSIWAVFARAGYNKEHGVPALKSAWGWFVENVGYLIIGGLISLFALLQFGELENYSYIAIPALIIVGLLIFLNYEKLGVLFDKVVKKKLRTKYKDELETLELNLNQKLIIFVLYFLSWILYSISYFLVVLSVENIGLDKFLVLSGINALSYTLGYLSIITPSGSGVREGVMIATLQGLNIMNEVTSILVTVIARIVYIAGEVIFFLLFKGFYLLKKKNEK